MNPKSKLPDGFDEMNDDVKLGIFLNYYNSRQRRKMILDALDIESGNPNAGFDAHQLSRICVELVEDES